MSHPHPNPLPLAGEGTEPGGELSVFKVITKEIVTETEYSFGEFGRKYLRGALSQKKLAIIFAFQIDFRYNLRSPQFSIVTTDAAAQLTLPPVRAEFSVRSLRFYDEQRSIPSVRCSANSVSFGASTGVHVSARLTGKRAVGPNYPVGWFIPVQAHDLVWLYW